jgi:hypothetical protein
MPDEQPPKNWDYTSHVFWLVAVIMFADLMVAAVPIIGCTLMGMDTTVYSGEARCNDSRKDAKDIILQLLSVALALMGANTTKRRD